MSNDTTQSFFFPDPYGTGQGVTIEATSFEDALKQLKKQAPKDAPQPHDDKQSEASESERTS